MELLLTAIIVGYIIYLRYYADLRTKAEQDIDHLQAGVEFYRKGQFQQALSFFTAYLQKDPTSSVAYLYQARCHRALGHSSLALDALKTGESYDDSVADLHLERGQILYEQDEYGEAFLEFDKAVFYSQGSQAEPYQWRGLARQRLHQPVEAHQDLDQAKRLQEASRTNPPLLLVEASVFFDRRLLTHALLILGTSVVLLVVIHRTTIIHLPYLVAALSAVSIGFLEPKKGWVLAILQAVTLWLGYTFFTPQAQTSGARELALFGLYGSIILTFIGSFVGGVLRRQLER